MAANSPPRFFAAWRVEAHFSAVFSFDGFFALCSIWSAVLLCMHLHPAPEEILFGDCGRPCDPLSCLLFTAPWLRCSQTPVVQETPSSKDVELTCSVTSLFSAVTCLPVGPMSLDWPVNPFGRSECSRPSLSPDAPSDGLRLLFLLLNVLAEDRVLFTHNRRYSNVLQGGMDAAPSFPKVCDVLLGTPGALLDLFSPDKETGNPNSIISKNSWTITTSFASRKCMARTSFFKLFRCWLRDFDSFGTFLPDNENAGGSAICINRDLLLKRLL